MKVNDVITAATALPSEERAAVVDSLLKTLDPPDAAIDQQWLKIAAQRLDELRSGKVEAVSSDQVFAKIRDRLVR